MNREIKFRAWDKKNKIWSLGDDWSLEEIAANYDVWKDLELEWMQYTGLKDKNGVEIYEGDIVQEWLVSEHPSDLIYSVGFDRGHFTLLEKRGYDKHGIWNVNENLEVIGNIYENPELLTNSI